jgi:regulatory protein
VNVFVDEKYEFSLSLEQIVDLRIKVGQELDPEELDKFRNESEFGKLYSRTLVWVLSRPRSIRETSDYLLKPRIIRRKTGEKEIRKVSLELANRVISRLVEKKYLDDGKFAEFWVENRKIRKGISKKRLKLELMKKGVETSVIETVIRDNSRDEAEEIKKVIAKKLTKYSEEKMLAYLMRQGFDYQLAQDLVRESFQGETDW